MKYKIDRATLVHGGHKNASLLGPALLMNEEGKMCCLGQVCEQEGVPKDLLLGLATPKSVPNYWTKHKFFYHWFYRERQDGRIFINHWFFRERQDGQIVMSDVAKDMMDVNDNPKTTREQKEAKLIELAASIGHEFEFVGEYPLGVK